MLLTRAERAAKPTNRGYLKMNNVRAVPNSTEGLRTAAHDIANTLCGTDVGGECYHGGKHTCFTLQGRKPLPLYKVEEMCERCAAAWHAVMAASLLDSVVISQQFLGQAPTNALEAQFLHAERGSNGATVHGTKVRARTARRALAAPPKAAKRGRKVKVPRGATKTDVESQDFDDLGVAPGGTYSDDDRAKLVKYYQTLPRAQKAAFNLHYKVKAWQMRDWAK